MALAPQIMAVVNEESHKGEDFWTTKSAGQVVGYGVFDGHGGKDCARHCASEGPEGVLPQLLSGPGAKLPTAAEVTDVFWSVDAVCGPALAARGGHGRDGGGAHAGSTSNVLFVEALQSPKSAKASSPKDEAAAAGRPAGYRCIWAWTGDSTGITVDMSNGKLGPCTVNHVPDNPVEAANLQLMEAVGRVLLKGKGGKDKGKKDKKKKSGAEGGGDGTSAPAAAEAAIERAEEDADDEEQEPPDVPVTVADITAAMKKAGVKPSATCPMDLLVRAFEREQLIAATIPKGRKYRRNAMLQRRPHAKDENEPMVVATHEDPYSSHYRDLLMTRSICDWTKSCWVLPHPETLEFTVAASKRVRVVLASDGLWDICTAERAAEIVYAAETPQMAAEALLAVAKAVYQGERGLEKMGDDTTVMVVELNPSGGVGPPAKSKGGGCTIS